MATQSSSPSTRRNIIVIALAVVSLCVGAWGVHMYYHMDEPTSKDQKAEERAALKKYIQTKKD